MKDDYTVSVIVPGVNESQSIEELFSRVHSVIESYGKKYEFIFIDDGSTDDTISKVEELSKVHDEFLYISLMRNLGKSLALMVGFDIAKGDVIICMDADLQDIPEEIPKFLNKIEEGYDFVGGWRHERTDSFFKNSLSHSFNHIASYFTKHKFKDINCGFKAFTKPVAQRFQLSGDMHRLMPAIAVNNGFKFTELPITHAPRKFGSSRYPMLRYRGLLDLIAYTAQHATHTRPMHIMCEIGICLLFGAGLAFAIALVIFRCTDGGSIFSLTIVFLLGFFGFLTSIAGVLCPFFGLWFEIWSFYNLNKDRRAAYIKRTSF